MKIKTMRSIKMSALNWLEANKLMAFMRGNDENRGYDLLVTIKIGTNHRNSMRSRWFSMEDSKFTSRSKVYFFVAVKLKELVFACLVPF